MKTHFSPNGSTQMVLVAYRSCLTAGHFQKGEAVATLADIANDVTDASNRRMLNCYQRSPRTLWKCSVAFSGVGCGTDRRRFRSSMEIY